MARERAESCTIPFRYLVRSDTCWSRYQHHPLQRVPKMPCHTCIILANGDIPRIETEIKSKYSKDLLNLRGVPKSLLPISGRPALSWFASTAKKLFGNEIYVVANAHTFQHYQRWAMSNGINRRNVINNGATLIGDPSQSATHLEDILLVKRVKNIRGPVFIVIADILLDPNIEHYWLSEAVVEDRDRIICYAKDTTQNADIIPYASQSYKDTPEDLPIAFVLTQASSEKIADYIESQYQRGDEGCEEVLTIPHQRAIVKFFQQESPTVVYTTMDERLTTWSHPDIGLDDYQIHWRTALQTPQSASDDNHSSSPIITRSNARIGLLGNPSDGFYGKTISVLISNFWTEVTLIPREDEQIKIVPNPLSDPHHFPSLEALSIISQADGYETGDRLLQATCKVFYEYCLQKEITLHKRGFSVLFETNIPRQVGLAGSSAIITAFWKALMAYYGVERKSIPIEIQPSLILSVEQNELGIAAGLQDRVIQTYGGAVFMDFDKEMLERIGHGRYEKINIAELPELWMAYVADPSDSGKIHNNVKARWMRGDKDVREAMTQFASFAEKGLEVLHNGDKSALARLMRENFALRRKIYGDEALGKANLRMIEIFEKYGCAAKFTGSGGAVVAFWEVNGEGKEEQERERVKKSLKRDLSDEGFVFVVVQYME
ncbi:uncharacterized protein VTP21DRAFT_2388 [Calcarisporiella thermophila]|uniref:uncharacterized protein n=1 Tax=Calcarisporiella thermophila TaxID=911321 RepID=UPI0037421313